MYYIISISKNGSHYFATAEHSLTDFNKAHDLYKDFLQKFPTVDGFKIEMTRWDKTGKFICRNYPFICENYGESKYHD